MSDMSTGPATGMAPGMDAGKVSDLGAVQLAQLFGELAAELNSQTDVTETLRQVVQLAVDTVPGCDFAGISWARTGEQIETPASTDALVNACDAVQYEYDEGPCVDSAVNGGPRVISDMGDEPRWPRFAARSYELGMRSLMSCELSSPRSVMGALNLYSTSVGAFDDEQVQQIALLYANHASIALANRVLESDLKAAVDTRGLIGQAIGILVERHRVTPQQAFELLVRGSQRLHVKLRELARQVVETGQDPSNITH